MFHHQHYHLSVSISPAPAACAALSASLLCLKCQRDTVISDGSLSGLSSMAVSPLFTHNRNVLWSGVGKFSRCQAVWRAVTSWQLYIRTPKLTTKAESSGSCTDKSTLSMQNTCLNGFAAATVHLEVLLPIASCWLRAFPPACGHAWPQVLPVSVSVQLTWLRPHCWRHQHVVAAAISVSDVVR